MNSLGVISGKILRPNRVVVYGQEGVGKTTLVAGLSRVLILDTEGGSNNIDVDRVPVASLKQLSETVSTLMRMSRAGQCPYETVALDTADRVWQMCADHVVESNKINTIEALPFGKGLKMATEHFTRLLTEFDSLAKSGLHVVFVCHSKVERMSPPDTNEYTMYQVKVSAPGKQAEEARELLKQWGDAILFCRFAVRVAQKDGSNVGRAVGAARRCIATTHTACWEAKNRVGLPDEIDMTPEALAPLFPKLRPSTTGTSATTAAPQRPATGQNPGQGGSDPAELGFKAPAPAPARETPQQDPERSAPAAPAPTPAPQLPEALKARRDDLTAFLVARGAIRRGQAVEDAPANWLKRMMANPDGVLSALDSNK